MAKFITLVGSPLGYMRSGTKKFHCEADVNCTNDVRAQVLFDGTEPDGKGGEWLPGYVTLCMEHLPKCGDTHEFQLSKLVCKTSLGHNGRHSWHEGHTTITWDNEEAEKS